MEIIKYTVYCPRDYGKIYTMTIRVTKLKDGTLFASPCNGCDYINKCNRCITELFKKSVKDPTMQSYEQPIIP